MARLTGLFAAAAIVGATVGPAHAQSRIPATPLRASVQGQQARLMLGSIQGTVIDDRGGPVAGAMVSALGAATLMATTDARGRFVIQPLPSGEYQLRVHRAGFVSTRRDRVRVNAAAADVDKIQMRRADDAPLAARTILAAGMSVPSGENPVPDDDNHSETAWRLRHIKRSVLKQESGVVSIADAARTSGFDGDPAGSIFGRALDSAATMAATFFTATPFSGEVNFLTTSAFGPGPLLFSEFVPRGVAYMSIGAPAAAGRWDVRASMSQSDVSAWIVAGSFSSRIATSHDSAFGVSYSTQQYTHPRRALLSGAAPVNDESRNVGEIYGRDRWTVSPTLALEYGARYARYDYLRQRSLLSPRLGLTLTPYRHTFVTATAGQRMVAPGAEEFLAPATVGPWLPPERTFAPLEGEDLRVERVRFVDVGIAHEFSGAFVIGVRRFEQRVNGQVATLFGLPINGGPKSPGHYFVANAGGLEAEGWGVRWSSTPAQKIRGSVDYSVTRTQWIARGDMAAIAMWAPAAIRPRQEDIHDVTTSLETELPHTATRVFVLYKVNNAFARGNDPTRPSLDYRFDVQVNQALPFMPFSNAARWEVLVGLRNLFRDPNDAGSIYDELLVVRPPKRMVGGVLIRF
ncbi:MAG TPA: TonB-dependent receptor [Vicinamibacterales bacterium]|nr:TonB-dependent receptor [Vicinamibacterales bacterium]